MGVQISKVHRHFRDYYDEETRRAIGEQDLFGISRVVFASAVQESKKINSDQGPCVIIASSRRVSLDEFCIIWHTAWSGRMI